MIAFTVNGVSKEIGLDANTPLLWVLREHLALTGTKFG
jgi:isoquinoline 1-oxidoreductase alpha subunit